MGFYTAINKPSSEAKFNTLGIYVTLQNLPNSLIMIGYSTSDGFYHWIAVSTDPKNLFVFDSNLRLFQFSNLEILSRFSGRVLEGSKFGWFVTFPIQ